MTGGFFGRVVPALRGADAAIDRAGDAATSARPKTKRTNVAAAIRDFRRRDSAYI
jgi:hypothetical protein